MGSMTCSISGEGSGKAINKSNLPNQIRQNPTMHLTKQRDQKPAPKLKSPPPGSSMLHPSISWVPSALNLFPFHCNLLFCYIGTALLGF